MCPAKYGQHFLTDETAIQKILDALDISPHDHLIEIGPGKGALTFYLVENAPALTTVEIDGELGRILREKYSRRPHFKLIHGDFLSIDLNALPSFPHTKQNKLVGNLPYSITSPILRKISHWTDWTTALFMVQKEVGDRLCAGPGTKTYGALTVGMNLTCDMSHVFDLPPEAFRPSPKVHSSVVKFNRRPQPLTQNVGRVQKVIQAAFQQRRKTILNSLSHGLNLKKEALSRHLAETGIPEMERPENIEVQGFIHLSDQLAAAGLID